MHILRGSELRALRRLQREQAPHVEQALLRGVVYNLNRLVRLDCAT